MVGGKFGLTYPVAPVKAPMESPTSTLNVVPLKTLEPGPISGPESVTKISKNEWTVKFCSSSFGGDALVLFMVTAPGEGTGGGARLHDDRAQGTVGDHAEGARRHARGRALRGRRAELDVHETAGTRGQAGRGGVDRDLIGHRSGVRRPGKPGAERGQRHRQADYNNLLHAHDKTFLCSCRADQDPSEAR